MECLDLSVVMTVLQPHSCVEELPVLFGLILKRVFKMLLWKVATKQSSSCSDPFRAEASGILIWPGFELSLIFLESITARQTLN